MPLDIAGRVPGGRRDPALRRSRARPRLHRPPAATRAATRRRCSSAPTPCAAPSERFVPQARRHRRGRASPTWPTRARRSSRACRAARPSSRSRRTRSTRIAELIRRQRGGAAVVLGALSPRTRNAQVALYQIRRCRFPGRHRRHRHGPQHGCRPRRVRRDATSSTAIGMRPLTPDEARPDRRPRRPPHERRHVRRHRAKPSRSTKNWSSRVEGHRYEPVRVLQWRNSALRFLSLDALLASLDEPPPTRGLVEGAAGDRLHCRCSILAAHEEIRALATAPAAVHRLWDACQLPDFRKLSPDEHVRAGAVDLPSSDERRGRAAGRLAGAADRAAATSPKAMSTRCQAASRRSAPGPTPPIAPSWIERPRRIGRKARARSRIACPMRCTSG